MHLTVANLNDKFHRASEAPTTEALLKAIFPDEQRFAVHGALPQVSLFGDEGAANHNRLGGDYGAPGVQLFIYGRQQGAKIIRCATRRGRRSRPARPSPA